ncbi:hypothetical protein [Methylobacterium sp. J-090]|uniref:hypothetical protein n=1 Tax=Methylobacterium sp. J-090 TaxID=2836666 RepID=UPI001FBAC58C|nr:hypothetical protein [Methylobacterium sp. J-090]MCJ2082757.1 hypothetical protein [Methylobacterium sp. J-090]
MDDATYKNQLKRKGELLVELKAVEEYLRAYENLMRISANRGATPQDTAVETPSTPKRRERNIIAPARLAKLARDEIVSRGKPMTRGELVDAFDAAGIPLAGSDKAKNIGTIMWRFRDEFLNVPGQGYWPKDVPNDAIEGAGR